jgi:hypothetical protein
MTVIKNRGKTLDLSDKYEAIATICLVPIAFFVSSRLKKRQAAILKEAKERIPPGTT